MWALSLALAWGCSGDTTLTGSATPDAQSAPLCAGWEEAQEDVDEDGYPPCRSGDQPADCDDLSKDVHPGAPEICNNIDDDCDGYVDDADPDGGTETRVQYFPDFDLDTFGDANHAGVFRCVKPEGWVEDHTDCFDDDPLAHPGAKERCDGKDTDCNGSDADERVDGDGDIFTPCRGDCDDTNPAIGPEATDVCNTVDDDCDGAVDEAATKIPWYPDGDSDGYGDPAGIPVLSCGPVEGYIDNNLDCNDKEKAINPKEKEVCDGIDQNCSGAADEGFDKDGDGFTSCDTAANALDCNDQKATVFPGAKEECNDADEDCDGIFDEDTVQITFYADADGDGFHNPDVGQTKRACKLPAAGFMLPPDDTDVLRLADCNDKDSKAKPGAEEACDGVDNDCDKLECQTYGSAHGVSDCDRLIDEGFDEDGDTFTRCNTENNAEDCDDSDPAIHPPKAGQQLEVCNEADDDCDGKTDEESGVPPTSYADNDGDGFPNLSGAVRTCEPPVGFIRARGDGKEDCDDTNADIFPGAPEKCDGIDNDCDRAECDKSPSGADCDALVDEGFPKNTYYHDQDHDGFMHEADQIKTCRSSPPEGWLKNPDGQGFDCNDGDAHIYPGAPERCDGLDNDCDCQDLSAPCPAADIDEGFDGDGDGFSTCPRPGESVDCDDGRATVNPEALEGCNGRDDDCDAKVDEVISGSAAVPCLYTGVEACDGRDNDGDGLVDEGLTASTTVYADADGDGYINRAASKQACGPSVFGYLASPAQGDDCDDADAGVHPSRPAAGKVCDVADPTYDPSGCVVDACDGRDNDCDTRSDEDFDQDKDGFPRCDTPGRPADCNDQNPDVHPCATVGGCPDTPGNCLDDDCDGFVDETAGPKGCRIYAPEAQAQEGDAAPDATEADATEADAALVCALVHGARGMSALDAPPRPGGIPGLRLGACRALGLDPIPLGAAHAGGAAIWPDEAPELIPAVLGLVGGGAMVAAPCRRLSPSLVCWDDGAPLDRPAPRYEWAVGCDDAGDEDEDEAAVWLAVHPSPLEPALTFRLPCGALLGAPDGPIFTPGEIAP